jgi:hypothetical protein
MVFDPTFNIFQLYGMRKLEYQEKTTETAMNIWGKLGKRNILVEKAKESTEKSKL